MMNLTQTVKPGRHPVKDASHITITVSGFMSQETTGHSWLPMLADNDETTVLYQLTWKSLTKEQVMQVYNKIVLKQGSKSILLGLLNGVLSLTDIVT